jgi:hypothetical protein
MRHALLLTLVAIPLAGCNVFQNDASRGYQENPHWNVPTVYTAADVRIVTQRIQPVMHNEIVCTEPSPDVAKALSTAVQASGQGGNGTVTAGLAFAGGSAEALAELAGRSTALLGLRDGLYRACEAYANGSIGADAYALIMSRYGQLMTTLFLGQDITGAAGAGGKALASSAALIALNGQSSGGGASTSSNNSSSKTGSGGSDGSSGSGNSSSSSSSSSGGNSPSGGGSGNSASTDTKSSDAGNNATQAAVGVAAAPAVALTRMNEDYFGLDFDPVHFLIVACINENDPTRPRPLVDRAASVGYTGGATDPRVAHPAADPASPSDEGSKLTYSKPEKVALGNPWLQSVCNSINSATAIANIEKPIIESVMKYAQPVDPVKAVLQSAQNSPPKAGTDAKPTTPAAKPPTTQQIIDAQTALIKLGLNPGVVDGQMGPDTEAAIREFQLNNKIPPTGQLDAETLKQLKVS